jgi:hypothetical protein
MNAPAMQTGYHSADVRIQLYVNGSVLPVAQLAPEFLVLRTPVDHPPCNAEIALSIDGHEKRWAVHLVNGIQAGCWETAIAPCACNNGPRQHQPVDGGKTVETAQAAMSTRDK